MISGHTKLSLDRWLGGFKNILQNYSEDIDTNPDLIEIFKQYEYKHFTTSKSYDP